MVYKKYVYKRGRKHGPYYYHSYRDGDSVKKIYIGGKKEYKKYMKKNKKKSFVGGGTTSKSILPKLKIVLLVIPILILLIIAGFFIYQTSITGKVSLNIQDSYVAGENITGSLRLNLKYGELLPINSKLVVEQNGVIDEIFLSELILSNIDGSFYVEGVEISGEGEGYGFIGEKTIYPEVFFKLQIYDVGEEPEGEIEEPEEETEEEPGEEIEEIEEETEELEIEEETEEEPEEELEEEPEEETEEEPEEEPEESESLITGEVVKEDKGDIDGICSKDNDFVYELEEGKTAEIKKNSVKIEEVDGKDKVKKKKIGDDAVELEISDNQVIVSTDYSVVEQGFGSDFLQDEGSYVDIDLEQLGIEAQEGVLTISLVYDGVELAEVSEEISVIGEEIPENVTEVNVTIPETNVTNVTIANETVVNISALITTNQYKAVINRPVKWIKTIKGKDLSEIDPLILELPKGAENITIKTGEEVQEALNEIDEYEQVIDETDRQSFITGQVTGDVSLEIRGSKGIITRFWEWITGLTITGNVIYEEEVEGDIVETDESKIIDLTDIANQTQENEIGVEYYTDAPVSNEVDISNGKRIIVSASSELGYTEILAYSLLDNSVSMDDIDKMRVYWDEKEVQEIIDKPNNSLENINNVTDNTSELSEQSNIDDEIIASQDVQIVKQQVNFTAYDLDGDGFVDYIEWIVPYLSEQVYEIIYITKAEHLDETRNFISDIYEDVREQDDNWSEEIPAGHYVRVTFERPLDKTKDITIYARRSSNGSVIINGTEVAYDVYEKKKRIDEIRGLLG